MGPVSLELKFFPQNGPNLSKAYPQGLYYASNVDFWFFCEKSPHSFKFLRTGWLFPCKNLRVDTGSFKDIVNNLLESSQGRSFSWGLGKNSFLNSLLTSVWLFPSPNLRMMNFLYSVEKVESLGKENIAWQGGVILASLVEL